jgi:hypothetical protein
MGKDLPTLGEVEWIGREARPRRGLLHPKAIIGGSGCVRKASVQSTPTRTSVLLATQIHSAFRREAFGGFDGITLLNNP